MAGGGQTYIVRIEISDRVQILGRVRAPVENSLCSDVSMHKDRPLRIYEFLCTAPQ